MLTTILNLALRMLSYKRLLRLATLFFFVLILSQCQAKESGDYIKEGNEFVKNQQYDRAMESFLKAIEASPNNAEAHYSLGGMYNYKEQYEKAEQEFKTALRLDPTHYDAHYSLGYTYESMGRKEEAEKQYRRYKALKNKYNAILKREQEKH